MSVEKFPIDDDLSDQSSDDLPDLPNPFLTAPEDIPRCAVREISLRDKVVYDQGEDYQSFLTSVRKIAENHKNYELRRVRSGKLPWDSYRTVSSCIEASIREYVPDVAYREFLSERREVSGQAFALDVMGPGGFLNEEYPLDGEAAITLVDHRSFLQRAIESAQGKEVIAGDVLDPDSWRDLKRFLYERDDRALPGFDLITCSPGAGWNLLRGLETRPTRLTRRIEREVLQYMVDVLNPQDGRLDMYMSSFKEQRPQWEEWVTAVNDLSGYEAHLYGKVLRIIKHADTTSALPEIPV